MLLHLGNSSRHFLFRLYLLYHPLFIHLTNLRSLFPIILSLKVTPEDVRKLNLPPEHINKTPSGETFVKQSLQKVATFWIDYSQILLGYFLKEIHQFTSKTNNLFQGILPEILEELISARKRAKADLKVTCDSEETLAICAYLYAVFNNYWKTGIV